MDWKGQALCALSLFALAACREGEEVDLPAALPPPPLGSAGSIAPELPAAPASFARPTFCDRASTDVVHDLFCDQAPAVRNLRDLQELVDVEPAPANMQPNLLDPYAVKFVIAVAHSTSISGHLVSPINPRVMVVGKNTISSFQRGVQHFELATRVTGSPDNAYNFYLVTFEQACNASEGGCSNADLFTPRIETDWTRFEIRDDEDLKNTTFDCRQCHQRARDTGMLLMREFKSPWTHFFETIPTTDNGAKLPGARGSDLMLDFIAAKGDELYGGASLPSIPATSALILQSVVSSMQPLLFDSRKVEDERWPYGPDGYAAEPKDSPYWQSAYQAFKRGEQLALPYFEQRVTDAAKQAQLTAAYASYRAGTLAPDQLPDLADIFPDDPHVRAQMGLQTEPDATPQEALIQACGSCHNDVLDQSVSRARFNIDLSKLDPSELEIAIDRLGRDRSKPGAMPPREARELDPATRARLIDYLGKYASSGAAEPQLENAAKLGMTGGGYTGGPIAL